MENKNELRKEQTRLENIFAMVSKVFHVSTFALAFFFVGSVIAGGAYLATFDPNIFNVFSVLFYIGAIGLIASAICGAVINSLENEIHKVRRELASPYILSNDIVDSFVG